MRPSSNGKLSAHPNVLIRRATLSLLRCLVISAGIHADDIPVTALKTVSGLLLTILDKGSSGLYKDRINVHKRIFELLT